ncbi:MAG TPA: hypothetical protein VL119_04315 [Acidimicrobiia bacterium]|nr:hypothetical protein [Acidimicrobiia bacterium]
MPSEEWIDHDGRVRRFTLTLEIDDSGDTATVAVDMRFTNFDAPVGVVAPPASDTVSLAKVPTLFKDLGGATASQAG